MKKLNSKLFQKFENDEMKSLSDIIGGLGGDDTGTCPTDYTTSGPYPDCTTSECDDIVVTDPTYDTPAG